MCMMNRDLPGKQVCVRTGLFVADSQGGKAVQKMTHAEEKTKEFVAKHVSQASSSTGKSTCSAAATAQPVVSPTSAVVAEDSSRCPPVKQSPPHSCPAESASDANASAPKQAPAEPIPEVANMVEAAANCTNGTEGDAAPVLDAASAATATGLGINLEEEVVNFAVDSTLDNVTNMVSREMASTGGELGRTPSEASNAASLPGGFDDMADRAVRASEFMGSVEEPAEESKKSERIVRPSMAVCYSHLLVASFDYRLGPHVNEHECMWYQEDGLG